MTFNQFFYFCFAASCLLFSCNSQDAANPDLHKMQNRNKKRRLNP
jgi:hypothetical protein